MHPVFLIPKNKAFPSVLFFRPFYIYVHLLGVIPLYLALFCWLWGIFCSHSFPLVFQESTTLSFVVHFSVVSRIKLFLTTLASLLVKMCLPTIVWWVPSLPSSPWFSKGLNGYQNQNFIGNARSQLVVDLQGLSAAQTSSSLAVQQGRAPLEPWSQLPKPHNHTWHFAGFPSCSARAQMEEQKELWCKGWTSFSSARSSIPEQTTALRGWCQSEDEGPPSCASALHFPL